MNDEKIDFEYNSDEDVNPKAHARLLGAVGLLDKTQHIKKATRNEPTLHTSEFDLVKSGGTKDNTVLVHDLVKVLGKTAKHADIGIKIKKSQRNVQTLPKPLEKPHAERIERAVGFENVKKQLGRWDAIVSRNRTASHQTFPLKQVDIRLKPTTEFLSKFRLKSELQKDLEALNPEPYNEDDTEKDEFPLTLEEILERRQEVAKLRAQQSYREAKARRQNKIKSKKYHRIQRREKIKKQIKDFEQLQNTDPEAALAQLELIEKSRALERASLRHKSTGKWASNLLVRAKYDKETRKELAEQLAVSRELTQKIKINDSDTDSEEENEHMEQVREDRNPWVKPQKTASEVHDFVSGYRKYWEQRNSNNDKREHYDKMEVTEIASNSCKNEASLNISNQADNNSTLGSSLIEEEGENINGVQTYVINVNKKQAEKINNKKMKQKDAIKTPKCNKKVSCVKIKKNTPSKSMDDKIENHITASGRSESLKTSVCTTKWIVTETYDEDDTENIKEDIQHCDLDRIFDNMQDDAQSKFNKKVKKYKKDLLIMDERNKLIPQENSESEEDYTPDLGFKNQIYRPIIDEEMNETTVRKRDTDSFELNELKKLSKLSDSIDNEQIDKNIVNSIDPTKFVAMKPKHLLTAFPNMVTAEEVLDDDEDVEGRTMTIAEAFEDDDIVDEFKKEKEDEINRDKPKDIDLTLPGWGSWGGKNIEIPKWKRKRFILKAPKVVPRRDDNKGDLIIKENANNKMKLHMVSELPFPFTSVRDFEASVRAPIGTTFVPEIAHRKLTKPAVRTKMGTIIEPMDDDMLVNKKKRKFK